MLTCSWRSGSLVVSLMLAALPLLAQQQLEIVEGAYGAGNFQMNVTQKLRGMVQNNVLDITAGPEVLGGDPAPGSAKRLRVTYRYNGRQYDASAADFEKLRIPGASAAPGDWASGAIPVTKTPAAASPGGFSIGDIWGTGAQPGLKIVSARYGDGTRFKDVREYLQGLVNNDALSVKVDNAAMGGDPAPAKSKALEVTYEYRGTTFQTTAKEGAYLALPDANARAATTAPPAAPEVLTPKQVLRIVTARYGGDNRYNDVRERLQGLVRDNALAVKVDNAAMGGDPAVGKDKALEVTYEWSGAVWGLSAKEGRSLSLPDANAQQISAAPLPAAVGRGADSDASRSAGNRNSAVGGGAPVGSREIPPIGTAGGLRIFYARYGAPGQEIDVREQMRPLLQGDTVRTTVGAASMGGDPAPGVRKLLTVVYEYRGRTYEKIAADGDAFILP